MRLAPSIPLTGTLSSLPLFGTARATIVLMRDMVRRYRTDLGIRSAAATAIFLTPERDEWHEVVTLFALVRDTIRYTRDVHDVETLVTPDKTLALGYGDCDDQSTLLATLLESVGYPTRFVAVGYGASGELDHVYVQVFACDDWVSLDPTENHALGWAPSDPVTVHIEEV